MIYNDDCILKMKDFNNESFDCIVADFPYYKIIENNWDNQWKNKKEYLDWCYIIIMEFDRLLKNNKNLFIFTSRQMSREIAMIMDQFFIEQRIIIWYRRRNFSHTRGKTLRGDYECILYYSKGESLFNNIKIPPAEHLKKRKEYLKGGLLENGVNLGDIWLDIPALSHNSKEKVNHPSQKPITLIERCVLIGTNENDLIFDPFLGSGTTYIACENLNRKCIGIEKEKDYYEICKERIQKHRKEAILQ